MKSKNTIIAIATCCLIATGAFAQSKKGSQKGQVFAEEFLAVEKTMQEKPEQLETKGFSISEPVVAPTNSINPTPTQVPAPVIEEPTIQSVSSQHEEEILRTPLRTTETGNGKKSSTFKKK